MGKKVFVANSLFGLPSSVVLLFPPPPTRNIYVVQARQPREKKNCVGDGNDEMAKKEFTERKHN